MICNLVMLLDMSYHSAFAGIVLVTLANLTMHSLCWSFTCRNRHFSEMNRILSFGMLVSVSLLCWIEEVVEEMKIVGPLVGQLHILRGCMIYLKKRKKRKEKWGG